MRVNWRRLDLTVRPALMFPMVPWTMERGMIKRLVIATAHSLQSGLLALLVTLAASATGQAQQFSAELVRRGGGEPTSVGRLYVSGDKVRLESPDFPDGFFLIDGTQPAAHFVRPASGVFMEARQSTALTRLFVPVDPNNPCQQWQAMAQVAGLADQGDWRCEPAPAEIVGTSETLVYHAVTTTGRHLVGWIDRTRRFPLRIKTDDGAIITAERIHDEPQPAKLFEMPRGARKFDPRALIEQIKQSDVWVAAPPKP